MELKRRDTPESREYWDYAERVSREVEAEIVKERARNNVERDYVCFVASRGKTDPPQDCDWPFCGCDERATKVIDALMECGWGPREADASPAKETP